MECKIQRLVIQALDKRKQCRLGDTQALVVMLSHKLNPLVSLRCPLGLKTLGIPSLRDQLATQVLTNKQHSRQAILVSTSLPHSKALAIHQQTLTANRTTHKSQHLRVKAQWLSLALELWYVQSKWWRTFFSYQIKTRAEK